MPTINMVKLCLQQCQGVSARYWKEKLLATERGWAYDKLCPFLCLVLSWGLIPTRSVFELPSNQGG